MTETANFNALVAPKKIAIITGSTRAVRIGPALTKFVSSILEAELSASPSSNIELLIVDIASFNLPVFAEAVIPAAVPFAARKSPACSYLFRKSSSARLRLTFSHRIAHAHSIAWSAEIARYDGYVLITACYNQGPPGAIKNAIDYLYNEIRGKPFLIVSYGGEGGGKASDSLAVSFKSMSTVVMETRPQLILARNEPIEYGITLDGRQAASGVLGEQSLKEWEAKKEEILKGFGDLKEFF